MKKRKDVEEWKGVVRRSEEEEEESEGVKVWREVISE